jgi:hypothetical protein
LKAEPLQIRVARELLHEHMARLRADVYAAEFAIVECFLRRHIRCVAHRRSLLQHHLQLHVGHSRHAAGLLHHAHHHCWLPYLPHQALVYWDCAGGGWRLRCAKCVKCVPLSR